jgi:hypothetical protein
MDLEFIVPKEGRDAVLAKLMREQCGSVSFIVGVMAISECTIELVRDAQAKEATAATMEPDIEPRKAII